MLRTIKYFLTYALALTLLFSSIVTMAQTAAGTRIQNQASASYRFLGDDTLHTTTSNLVTTIIQQVAGVNLTQDSTKLGAAGFEVFFPHVLTNTGNDADQYALSVVDTAIGDSFNFDSLTLYADDNHDGQADDLNSPITMSPSLAMGQAFYFVAVAKVPDTATPAQLGKLVLTATSQFNAAVSKINTDTVTVTNNAVVDVTKAMSHSSGASPSTGYTITLTYQNRSHTDATNITLIDVLPAGMTYVAGSAHWSVDASLVLTDVAGDNQGAGIDLIDVCAYDPSCIGTDQATNQFTAKIAQLSEGNAGSVSFDVSIDSGLAAQSLLNIAQFKYNDSSAMTAAVNTNTVPFEVLQSYSVVINGSTTSNTDGVGEPVTVASAAQGASVVFENIIWNLGNGNDQFNVEVDDTATTFPAGTVFEFLKADGATPLMDTNGDGIPDSGVLAQGESLSVFVRATLPPSISGDNGGAGYDMLVVATSTKEPAQSNDIINHLGTINASLVDLTNAQPAGVGGAPGQGMGPEADPVTTLAVQPGEQGVFVLYVKNTSARSDTYSLAYSASTSFAPVAALPTGWSAAFYYDSGSGDCSTLGDQTQSTGLLNAGQSRLICAAVTIPANQAANSTAQDVYFRALSATTGASDIKYDAVTVGATKALLIEPDHQDQVKPGSAVVYPHVITNNGNVDLEGVSLAALNTDPAWKSVLYLDVNGDSELNSGDVPYTPQLLAAGESLNVLVRVISPSNAAEGTANTTTITVTGHVDDEDGDPSTLTGQALTDVVKDVTTASSAKVGIVKTQALDKNCDGTPDGPGTCTANACFSAKTFSAAQNQCVIYRLTATNSSDEAVNNIHINDIAPIYTVFYKAGGYPKVTHGNISAVVAGQDGPIVGGSTGGTAVTLQAGESMMLEFEVKLE